MIQRDAVYRRDVGSADYLYGGAPLATVDVKVNLPASTSTPQRARKNRFICR